MKIKHKLALAFTATTLLPVLFLSVYSITQSREQAEQRFSESSARALKSIDQQFTAFFDDIARNVEFLARAPELRQADNSLTTYYDRPAGEVAAEDNGGNDAEIFRLFERFAETHPGFAYVYMGTRDGGYIQWPRGQLTDNYDPRKRPWYQRAFESPGQIALTGAYYWAADDATLMGVVRTFRNQNGDDYGVMAMDVSLSALTDMARDVRLGERGYLILVEDSGTVLVDASNPKHNFKPLADLGSAYARLAAADPGVLNVEIEGETFEARVHNARELDWKMIALMPRSEILAPAQEMMWTTLAITSGLLLAVILIAFWLSGVLVRPIMMVSEGLREIAKGGGDLTQRLEIDSRDETGQLAQWFNQFLDSIQALVSQINQSAQHVAEVAEQGRSSAASVNRASEHQLNEVEAMVAAVNQMSATANEVARSCAQTAEAANRGQAASEQGQAVIAETESSVQTLGDQVSRSVEHINELEQETGQINRILEVIRDIADQTNLLALNAAIEAARAGEKGRGFAVVADEVRTLAQRTQESTQEIGNQVERLNSRTRQVVEAMSESQAQSDEAVRSAVLAREAFVEIKSSVDHITDMAAQIASAAEQQHQVSEGINRNIEAIHGAANEVNRVSSDVSENAERQASLAQGLTARVNQFKA
ncbi:methyl-accepting chemotaxis protein [Marinobacterium litorale]|uniref:methyl-accepting chemotaxis protein n=1 Tax=Marinobacterium litorale TaxID=404770 RepID=UPI0004883545|nr:methyl-accepting chemotaxis protein [Marinobacterium litorale]